jgi:hypothetical protein
MATAEATNLVLDSAGSGRGPKIVRQEKNSSFTHSRICGGARFPGKNGWVVTNTGDSDATQAAAILTAPA